MKVVEVSERTCIGCGICMSMCPKRGIYVKHYKLESFSEMVKAAMEDGYSVQFVLGDFPAILS